MSEIFKAFENLQFVQNKKHYASIQGKKIEVSLQKSLEILQNGEDAYILAGDKIVSKPKKKLKASYRTLQKDKLGHVFLDGDIHWPEKIIEGGFTWQTESE